MEAVALDPAVEHLARCTQCVAAVKFQWTDEASTTVLAMNYADGAEVEYNEDGRPMCPNGHGEMEIADDQLVPVGEAFEQVAGQMAKPVPLPFPLKPFNDEGALEHIFTKTHERDDLASARDKRKDELKRANEDLSHCDDELNKLIHFYETEKAARAAELRLREEKIARGEDPDAEVVVCRFVLLHPGIPCPMSHEGLSAEHLTSEAHGCEAQDLLVKQEIAKCVEQLAALNIIVDAATLGALPVDQLNGVEVWALEATDNPENRDELLKSLPKGLGRPHVAAAPVTSEDGEISNGCSVCGVALSTEVALYAGVLVGVDCKGKDVSHHYPKTKKKKGTAPARKAKGRK